MISSAEVLLLLEKIAPACRRHSIRRISLSVEGIELEFAGGTADPTQLAAFQKALVSEYPSEEQVLFHSAPGGFLQNEDEARPEPELPKNVKTRRKGK